MNTRIRFFISLLIVLICMSYVSPVRAARQIPPAIRISVLNPPADLQLFLRLPAYTELIPLTSHDKPGYWRMFFYANYPYSSKNLLRTLEGAGLIVKTDNEEYEIPIEVQANINPNLPPYYSLNLAKRSLTVGLPAWFQFARYAAFIIFTLLLKCFVFSRYGYRDNKSWLIFILTNVSVLIIFSCLDFWLEISDHFYALLLVIVWYIFPGEVVVYLIKLEEQSKGKAFNFGMLSHVIFIASVIFFHHINLLD